MAKKYKISLTLISIFLVFSFFLLASYLKYQKQVESTNPLVIVTDGLSINFLNGNKIMMNEEQKVYTFSVTNNSQNEISYYIQLENVMTNAENVQYDLMEKNNKIKINQNELPKEDDNLTGKIKIHVGESHFYTFTIYNTTKVTLTAKLKVNIEDDQEEYFASTILNDNEVKINSQTKILEEVATDKEGLIEASDDSGTFYYFRGEVENNYVSFANLLWRIVKINSDGSVRLILNDYTDITGNFYNSDSGTAEERLDFSKNKMYVFLKDWYQENLIDYEANLISNKYCVDDSVYGTENDLTYYLGNSRLLDDYNISYTCLGTNYTSRIGLLSADEVILAGATTNENNTDYYLYLPDKLVSWWTLTPSVNENENITFFEVEPNGKVVSKSMGTYFRGIRPVINLVKRTSVTGSGTLTDPYTIK